MFKNYFKIAARNLLKNKVYTVINITGLGLGMACCILILLFVRWELSYDKFHKNAANLYRVLTEFFREDGSSFGITSSTPMPLGPALRDEFPEIANTTRFTGMRADVICDDKRFFERVHFADHSVFDVFTFAFAKGDSETALREPYSVVLTQETAAKYFGDEDPVAAGKVLQINGQSYRVTGVLHEIPSNSSIQFQLLASISTFPNKRLINDWDNKLTTTYVQLPAGISPQNLEDKLSALVEKYVGKKEFPLWRHYLQPLARMHLFSLNDYGFASEGNLKSIVILGSVASVILLIACFNFITLSIGISSTQLKGMGINKILGARRSHLLMQNWGETLLLCVVAVMLGIALAELFLPKFNLLTNRQMQMTYDLPEIFIIAGLVVAITVLAGSFPPLALAKFSAIELLSSNLKLGGSNKFTKSLVVMQFSLSLIFLLITAAMSKQIDFIIRSHNKLKGERVIGIPLEAIQHAFPSVQMATQATQTFLSEIRDHHNILTTTTADLYFGFQSAIILVNLEINGKKMQSPQINVDYDYLETFGLEMAAGRNFSRDIVSDVHEAILINQAMANELGLEAPVGLQATFGREKFTVVGVVKDYHLADLRREIKPVILKLDSSYPLTCYLKINPQNLHETLAFIKEKWTEIFANVPFTYSFLDEEIRQRYAQEFRSQEVFVTATILAILLSCIGIVGLTALTVARRTKEIAIRKIMGATVTNLVTLISKEFLLLVALANLAAWPIAYYFINKWLQNYAYRSIPELWIFIVLGLAMLGISFMTLSVQTIKAALAKPVEALRYE